MLLTVKFFFLIFLTNSINSISVNPEEGDLFEGDIEGIDPKGAAQIPTAVRELWPFGIVPYIIDSPYSEIEIKQILSGMKYLEDATRVGGRDCIKLVPRSIETNYVRVYNGSGCSSSVGKQVALGPQNLSLGPGCLTNAVVAHEFLHALGFWHEQSRPDRDDYITVLYENIQDGRENNFNKYNTNQVDYLGFGYDYDSVMHYSAYGFSKNGEPTIVPKDKNAIIGQRKYLSPTDISEVRAFYHCN